VLLGFWAMISTVDLLIIVATALYGVRRLVATPQTKSDWIGKRGRLACGRSGLVFANLASNQGAAPSKPPVSKKKCAVAAASAARLRRVPEHSRKAPPLTPAKIPAASAP
jgi:hypothetical protein